MLALDKVIRNRKGRQCVDKDDSMTDMTDLKQVIYFLAIMKLLLVAASTIVVTMYTTYHIIYRIWQQLLSLSFCAMHPPLLMVMLNYR